MDPNEHKPRRRASKPVSGDSVPEKYSRFRKTGNSNGSFLYLKAVDPSLLQDAIESVTANGDLISFTRTSDGGAICITITSHGDQYRQYASGDAELTALLETLT